MSLLALALASTLAAEPTVDALRLPEGADPNEYVQATWLPALEVAPIEIPAWQRYWRGDETEYPDNPRWIVHVTGPRETRDQLATRYAVQVERLREWNPHDLAKRTRHLKQGLKLRIRAHRIPPAREPIAYVTRPGDSWESVAVDHRVDVYDLKVYNKAGKEESMDTLATGRELTVWVDPSLAWTVNRSPGLTIDPAWFDVPQGALSHGHPNRGRIKGEPCQLPDIPELYTRRFDRIAHGSSFAIEVIVRAFAQFRHDTGYTGDYYVGSVSRPHGRRFPPHRSHQSGRDVDIRLPLLPWFPPTIDPAYSA